MTREEAIEELKQRVSNMKFVDETYVDCVNGEALEMAIEALEKQIPKKPNTTVTDEYDDNKFVRVKIIECKCSRCNQKIFFSAPLSIDGYCRYCGQALDWSDLFGLPKNLHITRADGNLVKPE